MIIAKRDSVGWMFVWDTIFNPCYSLHNSLFLVAPILDRNHPSYERAGLAKKDIRCIAEYSNPPPTFSWMYSLTLPASWQWVNGTMLHRHGVRIANNGPLTSVLHVPKGIQLPPVIFFLCKASNKEGLDEAIFELHTISFWKILHY